MTGYNGLGERIVEKDAEDLLNPADPLTVLVRDRAGRVTDVFDDDGATKYVWDTAAHGVGQLHTAASADGVLTTYAYDDFGRPSATQTTLAGATYEVARTYDPEGRLDQLLYPDVPGRPRFALSHHYDAAGRLDSVTDVSSGAGAPPFATLLGENEAFSPTTLLLGDGSLVNRGYDPATGRLGHIDQVGGAGFAIDYTYYLDGNLKTREEPLLGRMEELTYDGLDRLASWTLTSGGASTTTTYGYDDIGNLTMVWKGGQVATHNLYGANGRPHALSSDLYGLFTPNQYDARGRLQSGNGRTLTYNEVDLPETVTTAEGTTHFGYDAFGGRAWKEAPAGQTLYLGELYERRAQGGLVEHVFHVAGPTGRVADVVYDELSTTEEVVYIAQDGLGSTTWIGGSSGSERSFFDPFGRRVAEDGNAAPAPSVDTVGFTGHLHDDDLGLIAMRGRVYDPELRRFLTPDPLVPEPFFGQSYNRYSYVLNNPLRYVDPSGFQEEPSDGAAAAPGSDVPEMVPSASPPGTAPPCGPDLAPGCETYIIVHGEPRDANASAQSAEDNAAPADARDRLCSYVACSFPSVELAHPVGPGSFDPFGLDHSRFVVPTAPVTVLEQFVTGDHAGGRRIFISPSDGGLATTFRNAFNPDLEFVTVNLQFREFQPPSPRAQARVGLGIQALGMAMALLTPGPEDDLAVLGGSAGAARGAGAGKTVLGKFPDYVNLADDLAARRFSIPTNIWNKMTPAQQWAANRTFLARMIARGDEIILSNPVKNVSEATGWFGRELNYLVEQGFRLSADGTRMIR